MIEIGQESEFEMSYDEAVLYCFLLGDGWRLPTKEEYYADRKFHNCWHLDDPLNVNGGTYIAIPVRDLKDD